MKIFAPSLLLAALITTLSASAQRVPGDSGHFITDTPGATGTSNWYRLLFVSEVGAITEWFGNSADGRSTRQGICNRTLLDADPGGNADTTLSGGTEQGGEWMVKIGYTKADGITRIWGRETNGQYWEGMLVTLKIEPDRRPLPGSSRRKRLD